MAGRLTAILTRFSGCFYVTRSIQQSVCFALKLGTKKNNTIRINNKHSIVLRKNETDQEVFLATFVEKYHRSTINLGPAPVIIDLGCNIGLTILDFKQEYPSATIIGVEMDEENYDLCKTNTSQLTGCSLFHAAIWKENGFINYKGIDEQSYTVEKDSFGQSGTVRCMTMDALLKENNIQQVDYIKMDIEGAEKALLLESSEKAWLKHVKYLSIEVHDLPEADHTALGKSLQSELQSNDFIVYKSAMHISSLFAINKSLLSQ
jgi:FkbM family methyltransferase